ncbi:sugar kinase [Nakamurella lactea]|uniref:sugar kinase n=1 Tax=Nakamurella lactea TaxID=459515 RepID=UPI00041FC774|nr:sugar kinase [Nakamurella lactea]
MTTVPDLPAAAEGATPAGPDLLTLGEVMRVFVAEPGDAVARAERFRSSIGGAEGNVAIAVARLGLRASWVGNVGTDDAGSYVLRRLRAEGVDVDGVGVVDGFTGMLIRNSSADGAISVSYHRAGSAGSRLDADLVRRAWAQGVPRAAHVSGITGLLSGSSLDAVRELMTLADDAGVPVSFDVNLRTRLAPLDAWRTVIPELAGRADLVFAGEAELALVEQGEPLAVARGLCERRAKAVVLKNSDHTCTVVTADGVLTQPPLARRVVDPVGAGDGLVAGYLTGFLAGDGPAECLRQGAAVAAFAVGGWSDTEDYPTPAELAGFLASLDGGVEQVLR